MCEPCAAQIVDLGGNGAFSTLVAVWAGVVRVPATAGAAPAPPGVDDFYRAPDGFESTSPGTILRERPMRLASYSALPFNAQAWQLLYRTTDLAGGPMSAVTTVILPAGPPPPGGRPLLSYQMATDSIDRLRTIGRHAARIRRRVVHHAGADDLRRQALQRGWAVSVPITKVPRRVWALHESPVM